jgi:hypothetical protein
VDDEPKNSRVHDVADRVSQSVEAAAAAALERATRPILVALRWTVLAAIVISLILLAAVAAVEGLVRLFDTDVFKGRVWATDLLVAGIFLLAGALCWALSRKKKAGERA